MKHKKTFRRTRLFCIVLYSLFFLTFYKTANAQEFEVNGKVTSSDGEELPGVNVVEENTTKGTITNPNGDYSIRVSDEETTLIFSYVGYLTERIQVNGNSNINLTLVPDLTKLDEVIVVGYGTVKKSDLTGSVSKVSSDELQKRKVSGVDQALQGLAAGVHVTQNTGAPGSTVSVKIRGIGTVNSSEPLYVVDGVPISDNTLNIEGIDNKGSIDFLNPNDIESIEILKDASSTAIYGARGANGVVLITTKKGETGKTSISYDSYYGIQNMDNKIDVLNARQFADLKNYYDTVIMELPDVGLLPVNKDIANVDSLPAETDWQDKIFRSAPVQSHQLTLRGGTEKSRFLLSGNYFQQDGIVKNASYERLTVRVNTDFDIRKNIKVGENFSFTSSKRNRIKEGGGFGAPYGSPIPAAIVSDPTTPVYDSTGNWSSIARTKNANPVGLLERQNYTYDTKRLMGNIFGDYEIMKNLKFRTNFGLDMTWGGLLEFLPSYFIDQADQLEQAQFKQKKEHWFNWTWENTLTYSAVIGDKHNLTLLAGITSQEEIFNDMQVNNTNFPSNDPFMRYLSALPVKTGDETTFVNGEKTEWALYSYLGRLNYAFDNRYLLTASVRRDGSSRFGSKNRWGTFPSVALAWKIHNEKFFNISSFVNTMKLRLSWGQIGNQNIGLYQYSTSVNPGYNYRFGPDESVQTGYAPTSVTNDEIHWETTTSGNIGLDLGFLRNKISFSGNYYLKRTTDILLRTPVPAMVGLYQHLYADPEYPYWNSGEVLNKGIEFQLTYREMEGEFNYKIGINMSTVKNEVIDLKEQEIFSNPARSDFASITVEGEPIASFYGFKTLGLFQSQEEIDNAPFQANKTAPGDIRFADISGPDDVPDDVIDDYDKTIIGSPLPKFSYGANLDFFYKNFDLLIFFQGVYGNDIYNNFKSYTFSPSLSYNVSTDMLNHWTETNKNTDVPRLARYDANNNLRISDRFIEDGSYMKLRNLTLGYTFPENSIKAINTLRLYVTGKNILTLTNYSGYDPEIGKSVEWNASPLSIGMDRGNFPQARVWMAGINLTF